MRLRMRVGAGIVLITVLSLGVWLHHRTRRYDHWIARSAAENDLDTYLVKALIYEESWFQADARGTSGELGLMQISSAVASDYSARKGLPAISEARLLEPELNIEIGCWYLGRSINRYKSSPAPTLFALLRYNAGESRADGWLQLALAKPPSPGASPEEHYLSLVDFPMTRAYARRILQRARSRRIWF